MKCKYMSHACKEHQQLSLQSTVLVKDQIQQHNKY